MYGIYSWRKSLNVTPATAMRGLIELNADYKEAESDMQEDACPSPDVELKLRTIKDNDKDKGGYS